MLLTTRGFNNLFDEVFDDPFSTRRYDNTSVQVMKTDIHEKDGNYIIKMDTLPLQLIKTRQQKKKKQEANASTKNAIPEPATEASMLARN